METPSEEVSDEGDSDKKDDDMVNEDPEDEDPVEEEPSEGDVDDPAEEEPVEEEVEDPAIDPDQITIMDDEQTSYTVTLPGADAHATVAIVSGVEDGKTDASADIVFTVTPDDGYELATNDAVQYKVGDGTPTTIEASNGSYTIQTDNIKGDITISVSAVEIQYQITFAATNATVKIGEDEVTGPVTKKLGDEVEFVVTPETGKKLRYVNTKNSDEDAMSPTSTDAEKGTYTYTYTVNAADATAKAISIYVNATEAQNVTVSFNKTGTNTDVSVYEVKETEVDSSKVLTVEDTAATSISSTEDSKVYFIAELPETSVSAITSVKVGEKELSPVETTVTRKVGDTTKDDIKVDLYTLDLKDISTNVQVDIVTELDETKANVATFSLDGEGDYMATVGGKEYNVGDKALTGDDSITFTVEPTEDYFQIDKVEAVYETAKADGSGKEEKTDELKADEDSGEYTFTFKDTEKNETVTREVTIKVTVSTKGSEDAMTITVNNTSDHMKYEVAVKDEEHPNEKVTRKAGTNHSYIVEKGATYVNMTVKADDKFAPVVAYLDRTIKGEKTEDGYKYAIPAVSLASDGSETIITIDEEAEQKWVAVLYNDSEVEVSAKASGKEIEEVSDYSVFTEEETEEFNKIESDYVVYRVPTDTEVTVAVTAKDNSSVASYTIGSKTTNLKVASGKTGEFKVKASDNTTVQINTDSVYGIILKDETDQIVEGAKDAYAVDYGTAYTVALWKGEARANVTAVAIEGTDAASTAALEEIAIKDKKYNVAKINVAAADAGKTLTVKLSVAGKVTEDGVEKDGNVIVHTFKLSVNPKATKLEIKGAKNDKLTQTVDTKTEYVINPTPKTVSLGNIEAEVTAAADGADAAAITAAQGWVQARVIDGKLEVITKAVKDPADKTDDVAKIVLKDKTTNEALTSVKVDAVKPAFTSEEPGVKAVGSDDISLDLELTAPKKVTPPNAGKLWYKVVVKAPDDAGTEITSTIANPFYIGVKTDEDGKLLASQTENIRVNSKEKGEGKACNFTVAVTLVQTIDATNLNAENEAAETSCTSKTKDNVAAGTKTPYYTSKLSFKKGAGTVYTGQKVKIATPQFDKNTTWTEIKASDIVDTTDVNHNVSFSVENGDIYMSVEPYTMPLGKHTIEVTAYAPDFAYAAKGTLTVNVVRGIENISVSAPDTIYKADKKAATLKLAPTLNMGYTDKDWVPKTKKVSYEIVDPEYGYSMSEALKAAVSVKANGTVTVAKDYKVLADRDSNKFAVKVTAADFVGNTVSDVTNDIEITATGMALGEICIADYGEYSKQYEVVSRGTDFTSKELDGKYLIVLKKGTAEKQVYSADEVIETNNLTFKSSNKALTIDSEGYLSVSKVANKVKLTATANDGSKNSVEKTINIIYDKPAQLGLRVERQDDFDSYNCYRIGEDNSSAFTFKGTPDTVLELTVVQRDDDKSEWEEVDQITDFKLAVSGAKVLNKNSGFNQWQRVIANKATVNVKLTVGSGKDKKDQTYTITNESFSTANAPKVKAVKGNDTIKTWLDEQTVIYQVTDTNPATYSGKKWVLVKTDATDRANAKKWEAYEDLEDAANGGLNGYHPIDKDGRFYLNFEQYGYTEIQPGSYKLQFTFGTVDADGQFTPETKTVAATLKAEAQKKGSYKAVSTVKMSLKDGARARLAGSGKNYSYESFSNLYNANINGKPNNFRKYFMVDSSYDNESGNTIYYLALRPQGDGTNNTLTADDIAYITGDSKEAKNDRIGYVDYYVYIEGVDYKEDTAKITVNIDKNADKTLLSYKASAPTIMEGTEEEFTINVTAGKANAELAYAYIEAENKFEAANMSCYDSIISVKAKGAPVAGSYKTDIYVVPTDNYYVREIGGLYTAWRTAPDTDKAAKLGELTAKIKERGVLVKTTIKVTAKDKTGNKIKIDKKDTAKVFSQNQYDGSKDAMNYYVDVPYTKTMPCYITEITSKDKLLDGQNSLFSFYADPNPVDPDAYPYISVTVKKADLEKAVAANKVKLGKQYTVKATVKFGKEVLNSETNANEWKTDDTIKTEEISLKLTLPQAVTSTGYAEAVAAVKEAKSDIIEKVSAELEFQKDWVDEYGNLNGYGQEAMLWFLEGALDNLMAEVRALAPEDSGTSVSTELVIDGMDYTDTNVFKAPTSQTDGYFKVVLRLAKTDVYDWEDPKAGTFEDITFELKIAKTMEEPNDLKTKLDAFVGMMSTNEAYTKAQDEDAVRKAILADAKAYVQIEKYDTLRMVIENDSYWDDDNEEWIEEPFFTPATDKEPGLIKGHFHVWGIRYGGEKLDVDFSINLDKLDDINATKSLIDTALALLGDNATNLTKQEEVMDAAKAAIVNKQFVLEWKQVPGENEGEEIDDWKLTPATRDNGGTIKGTLILVNTKAAEDDEDSNKQVEILIDWTIPTQAGSDAAIQNLKDALAINNEGKVADTDVDPFKSLVISNDSDTVKAAILAAATKAVEKDGYAVAYKKNGEADAFKFTKAKYKGVDATDTGKGKVEYTLVVTDAQAAEGTTVTPVEVTCEAEFGPYPELATLDDAKKEVKDALEADAYVDTLSNETTAESIRQAAENAITTGANIDVTVKKDDDGKDVFTLTEATFKEAGKIEITLVLSKYETDEEDEKQTVGEPLDVALELTIAKLTQEIGDAKTAAQTALNDESLMFTNDDIKDDDAKTATMNKILDAVNKVVNTEEYYVTAQGDTITATAATLSTDGSIVITIVITEKNPAEGETAKKEEIEKTYTIVLDQTLEEAAKAAADAIEAYGKSDELKKSNDDKNAILNAVKAVVKTSKFTVVWSEEDGKAFEVAEASATGDGSITGEILISVTDDSATEPVAVPVNITWEYVAPENP